MAKEQQSKIVTKKHLARIEKDNIRRRWLLIGTIIVALLVVGVIVYGILDTYVLKDLKPVAKVAGTSISVGDFKARVRYERENMVQNYVFYAQNTLFAQYFASELQNVKTQLDDTVTFGNNVLTQMVNEVLSAKEAEKRGITVSDAEVDEALQHYFSFYENGTPTPTVTPTEVLTPTLNATQMTFVIPPTATAVPTEEPATATPQATATPEATSIPTSGPTPTAVATATPYPTPTPYTKAGYEQAFQNYTKELSAIEVSEAQLRKIFRARLIQQKLYDAMTADVPAVQEQVWARHILVATEEEAKAVLERLKKGEDWVKLAAEVSIDTSNKDNGGDLGWFAQGTMVTEFNDAVFAMTPGQISDPVKTDFGYHIIYLIDKQERPLTSDQLQSAKQAKFNKWLEQQKTDLKVQTFDISTIVPVVPTIPAELQNIGQ